MNEVMVKQSYGKIYNPDLRLRKQMLDALRDERIPLADVVNLFYSQQGLKMKAKRILKQINWYLPFDLTRLLKRLS